MKHYRERAVAFGARGSLAGVLTIPAPAIPAKRTAVVILNAGVIHHVGPNRLHVRLARAAAQLGYTVLRFDLSGIGDSDPRIDENDLARAVQLDIADALDMLGRRNTVDNFVLLGLCSGAVNGFLHAVRDERVAGVVMIDPVAFRTPRYYVVRYARRAFSSTAWANVLRRRPVRLRAGDSVRRMSDLPLPPASPEVSRDEMDRGLATLLARGAQALVVFSGGLGDQYNYASQFHDAFPRHARNPSIRVKYFPSADHTFSTEAAKDALQQLIEEWIETNFNPAEAGVTAANIAANT